MSSLIQLILSNILNTMIYTSWITHHPLHHEGKLFTFGSVGSEKQYVCQKPECGKEWEGIKVSIKVMKG